MTNKQTNDKQNQMTDGELFAAIEKSRQERIQKFRETVAAAAQEYGCDLVAQPYITQDGTIKCTITAISMR